MCFSSHSSSGTLIAKISEAGTLSSPPPPNRSNCPMASAFLVPSTESTASDCTRKSPLRGCPSESNAPAFTRDSVTFLLQAAISILCR
ncbi:Uncharacterised protein [Mycobacteroides abscessus subsp. abscessus]|nr:Uncharacterised protein [Mycobacteroides abscessus subsp. abscessus]